MPDAAWERSWSSATLPSGSQPERGGVTAAQGTLSRLGGSESSVSAGFIRAMRSLIELSSAVTSARDSSARATVRSPSTAGSWLVSDPGVITGTQAASTRPTAWSRMPCSWIRLARLM
ncbi:hypothetical protein BG28_02235 [Nesterenkonia sp. AN1]|uniref:hypothetical protein n=1 Tax=Nesterenkonia sp. AN1 TaxID=652017 RepID=UPI00044E0A1C|nr:hypothetical protein [Nesterenkonia sp. AN1]EXF25104.1 hypothetical protein BG28_02235 [Nesterenkonia sp. AN1]